MSNLDKDILQGADTHSTWAMYCDLQARLNAIAQHMILSNSSTNRKMLK